MTITFTPPTFVELTRGDRSYVPELNENFAAIVAAFASLVSIADATPILQLSKIPALVLGNANRLIGNNSYHITGTVNSVVVSPGYAWLADEGVVVQNPGPVVAQLNQAGTWYVVIDLAGNPNFSLASTPPAGAFFSLVVTQVGELFNIAPATPLVPTLVSSSNPQGVTGPQLPLVVGTPHIFQIGPQFVVGLSSRDPRYAGFRLYLSQNGGGSYFPAAPFVAQKGIPLPGLWPYTPTIDYGSLNWVDWYTVLGLPQSEIDKIPANFKYKLVDQSYIWGNSITGRVKTADYPSHSDPDTSDTLVLDMSDSGETLFDPTLPTVIPFVLSLIPIAAKSGGNCLLEGGTHGCEAIAYSAFSTTGPNEITISAASGIRRAFPLYGPEATTESPANHPVGSRFIYLPYWVGSAYLTANRLYTPRYWVGGIAQNTVRDITNNLIKLAPIDIDGKEQDITTVPAYTVTQFPAADFVPTSTFIGYLALISNIPSQWLLFYCDAVGYLYYINRMFTIPVPAVGVPVTYYIYFVDPHYLGDTIDYGFLAGKVKQAGTGYAVGDTGIILHAGGLGDPATYQITQVDSTGGVLSFEIVTGGSFYDVSGQALQFTGLYGVAPYYNTLATSGSGTGMVLDCTQAGWFYGGLAPRTTCICTTDATHIGERGYINVGKVVANSLGTGANSGPDPSVLGTHFTTGTVEPSTGTCCQFAPNKIFVGNTGQGHTPPYTNSALVHPYYNQP